MHLHRLGPDPVEEVGVQGPSANTRLRCSSLRSTVHDPYCYLMPLDVVLEATRELLDGQSPLARWRATIFDDLQDVFLL